MKWAGSRLRVNFLSRSLDGPSWWNWTLGSITEVCDSVYMANVHTGWVLWKKLHTTNLVSGEFGTKWTRDQVNTGPSGESGPNIFGTRWIRDQTLGEFGTKFFLSYKYVNTGIFLPCLGSFSNILYSSIVICIFVLNLCLFCLFLPMIECALSFKIPCIPCTICACLYFIYKYSLNIRCSKGWCVHNYFCTHNYQKQYNWFQKHVYWFKQTNRKWPRAINFNCSCSSRVEW